MLPVTRYVPVRTQGTYVVRVIVVAFHVCEGFISALKWARGSGERAGGGAIGRESVCPPDGTAVGGQFRPALRPIIP